MMQLGNPPMIILLDILLVLVFVSLLDVEQRITIELPQEKLPKGATVVKKITNNKTGDYYVVCDATCSNTRYKAKTEVIDELVITCPKRFCAKYGSSGLNIIISGDALVSIYETTFQYCHLKNQNCEKLKIPLSVNGRVDKKKFTTLNPHL